MFRIIFTPQARQSYDSLKSDPSQQPRYKAVRKTIELLAENPRHNSLQTHEIKSLRGPDNQKVFEAYAQQNTPAAFRVFWCYGSDKNAITIVAITRHL